MLRRAGSVGSDPQAIIRCHPPRHSLGSRYSFVRNACEALDLWFEDEEEVEPRGIDSVASTVNLNGGAFLIAVPRISRSTKVKRINISLERGILDAIDAAAAARKLTRSAFIAEAAKNEIELAH
jgi:hypothetical protein